MSPRRAAALTLGLALAGPRARGAAFTGAAAGTTSGEFLEVPVSARGVAMGDAQAASVTDATALYYDPARLLAVNGASAVFTHAAYLQSLSEDYGALARSAGAGRALGVSVQHMSYGSFDRVDNQGVDTGETFAPQDLAVTGGVAQAAGPVGLGAALKYVSSRLSSSAQTFAVDAGAAGRAAGLDLALSAVNLGPGLRYREERAPLPQVVRLGAARADGPLTLAFDVSLPRGARPVAGAGAEYVLGQAGGARLAGRVGFNTRAAFNQLGGLSGLSAGLGFGVGQVEIDYALADYGDLGLTHRITAGLRWPAKR